MTMAPPAHAEDKLAHVAQRFAQWRRGRRTPRGRIPPPLWAQAVALTRELPLTRVAKRLRLCPTKLKKRGAGTPAAVVGPALSAPLHFVEVAPAALGHPPTTEVEVQRADGARLRLTYREANSALVPLVQTFLECR
jgi:hypothetical protein